MAKIYTIIVPVKLGKIAYSVKGEIKTRGNIKLTIICELNVFIVTNKPRI